MSNCVLAIDVGTSSARVIGYDVSGRSIPGLRAQTHYSVIADPSGKAEIGPEQLLQCVSQCVDQSLEVVRLRKLTVAAVGACTFWHSMVGVDVEGQAVTPIYTWADMRSAETAENLSASLDATAVHSRTGCSIHPSYWPAKLAWLSRQEKQLARRVDRWMSPGEYLYSRWIGDAECSISMASGTGLLDQNACDWDDEMLTAAGIDRNLLLPLAADGHNASGLRHNWKRRWPELAKIPWVPAVGDGAASNLGSGCANDTRVAINLGTSGAIRVLWRAERAEIPEELWCYRLDRQRFVMGAAFSDGGDDFVWAMKTIAAPGREVVEAEVGKRAPDCHGLTFLPFLAGERSMAWRPNARATLHGLSVTSTPTDIIQAIMEGVALRFALAADILQRQFPDAREVMASGGAIANSPAWARIIADAIGKPVTLSNEPEASSRGAALLALKAAGLIEDETDVPTPLGDRIEPDPTRHELLMSALQRQQDLYRRLV